MNKIVFGLSVIAFVACENKPSTVEQMEKLNAKMKETSNEYQRHIAREMEWHTRGVEMPQNVKDSFASVDSTYKAKMNAITKQIDSLSTVK